MTEPPKCARRGCGNPVDMGRISGWLFGACSTKCAAALHYKKVHRLRTALRLVKK